MAKYKSLYDETYAKRPRRFEWFGCGLDALELVCKYKNEQRLTTKQLAKMVGWSKKKLKRIMQEGTPTLKQVSHLMFALGMRIEVNAKDIPVHYMNLVEKYREEEKAARS